MGGRLVAALRCPTGARGVLTWDVGRVLEDVECVDTHYGGDYCDAADGEDEYESHWGVMD